MNFSQEQRERITTSIEEAATGIAILCKVAAQYLQHRRLSEQTPRP